MIKNKLKKAVNHLSSYKYFSTLPNQKQKCFEIDSKTLKETMNLPPWREASSLIIASKIPMHELIGTNLSTVMGATKWNYSKSQEKPIDHKILMVKRSGLSSFMASAYVFPGGLTDVADFSPRWRSVFNSLEISNYELANFRHSIKGPRPPMIEKPVSVQKIDISNDQLLESDIAFRITAIRETFEESGILLLTHSKGNFLNTEVSSMNKSELKINIDYWREKVQKDPHAFIDMCLEAKVCPNIWALHEWWDWLTPVNVGHRRYDAMFYLCCLSKMPQVEVDKKEVTTMKWASPQSMLEDNAAATLFLAPPQIYELSRLLQFKSFSALQQFAQIRGKKGVERWLPVIAPTEDGAISLLPGDDLYPKELNLHSGTPGLDFTDTLDELRQKSANLNRMEIRGPSCTIYSNIISKCGHIVPITYQFISPQLHSFL